MYCYLVKFQPSFNFFFINVCTKFNFNLYFVNLIFKCQELIHFCEKKQTLNVYMKLLIN